MSNTIKQLLLCFSAIIIFSNSSIAGGPIDDLGTIRGLVKTADGKPAGDVTVLIKGTSRGTTTDEKGIFEFRKLQAGNYTLQISLAGYHAIERSIDVENKKTSTVEFDLEVSTKQLSAVIVTANKKYRTGNVSSSLRVTTPILEMSQNIQVLTKGLIADQQAFDMLEGIQRNVSGAQRVEHWDNYARINMRGSQITAFRNGINVQMPWGPLTEDMSMVERIEFVKGPAGFMLANGDPSGFYNVVTKKPNGTNKGEISLSAGSFGLYHATADYDGKFSDNSKMLYRINLMGQQKNSHRDFEYNNRYSIVPVLKFLLDEKSTFTIEYTHQYSQMNVIGSNYAFSKRGYADLPVNFTTAEPNLKPSVIKDNSLLLSFEHRLNENWKFTAQAHYLNYNQTGQSIWPLGMSAENDSLMQRGISIWDAKAINKSGQFFLNGEFDTRSIHHKLLAGTDIGNKDYMADWNQGAALGTADFNIYKPVYGTIPAASIPQWDRSKDLSERGVRYTNSYSSFYVQDELSFVDNKLRITLAGRYTNNRDDDPYSGKADQSKFTPRAGLSWSIDRNTAAYFVYDQAFLANYGADWQGHTFDPITGDNLEAGIKKDWLGGRWNSSLSVYQITRNNVLTTDLEHPNPETGQFTYSRQTGQQVAKGVEFDLKGQLTRNIEAVVNYAFTEAKITKDSDPKVIGNQVAGATKHIHNSWLSYLIRDGKAGGLKFSLGYQYQAGRSSWYIFDNSENSLPDYFRLDGGISYSNTKFGINLNVYNLLDKYLYSGAPYGDMFYWQAEAKRNGRLTVTYRF